LRRLQKEDQQTSDFSHLCFLNSLTRNSIPIGNFCFYCRLVWRKISTLGNVCPENSDSLIICVFYFFLLKLRVIGFCLLVKHAHNRSWLLFYMCA
jgi:hypothetical protein